MKAAATHTNRQEAESHRGSFIQRSVDPMLSEEEEMPFVSAKRLGIQPKLKSSSDKFIQRQEETIGNILSWGKRWFANGIVINYSSRRVRVWSSDDGLYWIEPGQRSAISGEDVDHVQDHSGQWYKIGFNYVTVDRHGNVLGAQCRASGPGLDCSSTATTPERSDLDIDRPSSVGVQAKLIVGAPDDPYEQEADAMAEHVMRMPMQHERIPMIHRFHTGNPLQRMCSECEEEMQVQRICDDCEEETAVQRSESIGGEAHAPSHIANRLQSLQGQGSPLPISVQTQMGQSFGTDFSNVRIHTDTEAAQMSQDLNAQAFTHGSDIYFNQGKYDTGSSGGQRLLAHELTHTVQQGISFNPILSKSNGFKIQKQELQDAVRSRPDEQISNVDVNESVNCFDAVLSHSNALLTLNMRINFQFHAGNTRRIPTPAEQQRFITNFQEEAYRVWNFRFALAPIGSLLPNYLPLYRARINIIATDLNPHHIAIIGSTTSMLEATDPPGPEIGPHTASATARISPGRLVMGTADVGGIYTRNLEGIGEYSQFLAAHESGHLLGLSHVVCEGEAVECYGRTLEERLNIMGMGNRVTRENYLPFIIAMREITGVDWRAVAGGLHDIVPFDFTHRMEDDIFDTSP